MERKKIFRAATWNLIFWAVFYLIVHGYVYNAYDISYWWGLLLLPVWFFTAFIVDMIFGFTEMKEKKE